MVEYKSGWGLEVRVIYSTAIRGEEARRGDGCEEMAVHDEILGRLKRRKLRTWGLELELPLAHSCSSLLIKLIYSTMRTSFVLLPAFAVAALAAPAPDELHKRQNIIGCVLRLFLYSLSGLAG